MSYMHLTSDLWHLGVVTTEERVALLSLILEQLDTLMS